MPTTRILVLFFLLGSFLEAQTPERQAWLERLQQLQLDYEQSPENQLREELAKRREAQMREWRFLQLAQRFLKRWNELAVDFNSHRAVNPHKFEAVSKAFRELERSEGWLAEK